MSPGVQIDAAALTPLERVNAILLWSALPGASRHHWGTEFDLIDGLASASGYRDKLTQQEFAPGGPFAPLAEWLDIHAPRFGFFRPFQGMRSGVQPEPWHFSFAPIAELARRALSPGVCVRQSLPHLYWVRNWYSRISMNCMPATSRPSTGAASSGPECLQIESASARAPGRSACRPR